MSRRLPLSLLAYLSGGLALALILTGLSELIWHYHWTFNWGLVGLLYCVIGFSLTDNQSLASKPCMLQRNVDLDSRVQELLANGERFEGNRMRIVASYVYGGLFLLAAYFGS